jgi:hypothetical protein
MQQDGCTEVWSYSVARASADKRTGGIGWAEQISGLGIDGLRLGEHSLQMEEILQECLDVFVGFVRRRFLVVAARKSFCITRIAWRKR